MVFLDNGSTDGTLLRLAHEEDVSVYRTQAPFKTYKHVMRRWLLKRFGRQNWVLCVDIDEFFDYPFRESLSVSRFLQYLNKIGADVVVGQMLDLCPKTLVVNAVDKDWRQNHCYYTFDQITRCSYREYYGLCNEAPEVALDVFFGGIRASVFDVRAFLTKHPLQRPRPGIKLISSHSVIGARVADVSAVLLHYKYVGNFAAYARRIVAEKSFFGNSQEYKKYVRRLNRAEEIAFFDGGARRYNGVGQLVDEGFLVTSERFRAWAAAS